MDSDDIEFPSDEIVKKTVAERLDSEGGKEDSSSESHLKKRIKTC